jgi:hypothetical protein
MAEGESWVRQGMGCFLASPERGRCWLRSVATPWAVSVVVDAIVGCYQRSRPMTVQYDYTRRNADARVPMKVPAARRSWEGEGEVVISQGYCVTAGPGPMACGDVRSLIRRRRRFRGAAGV